MSEDLTIDNFRLTNCVASGSSSQIWEAIDEESNERFAMKLLLEEAFKQSEAKATLKKEYKIASSLEHPNIIQVYGHNQTRKHAYMIMEFFGGPNLKQIVRGDIVVIHSRFRKMTECLLMALDYIHGQGWLHRDVKPDNIMMTKATEVRLVDFSLSSKIPSAVARLMSGKRNPIQGTRTYIAPEIVRRKLPSPQSDLYSLGVTLFECLTGRAPFMGTSPNDLLMRHIQEHPPEPSSLNLNISTEMDKFIMRLLAKKPENRPDSAGEALSELRNVKIFKEDPEVYAREKAERDKDYLDDSLAGKLDSRTDAERQEKIRTGEIPVPPPKTEQKQKPKPAATPQKQSPQKPQQRPGAAPSQAPGGQQQRPPQQHPGHGQPPMQPPPGWGQPQPGQPMPGHYAQYPGQQPGQYPPQPGQQPAPQQRPAPQQQPQQPSQQDPRKSPPQQKPKPQEKKKQESNPDDLPFADELPDIM